MNNRQIGQRINLLLRYKDVMKELDSHNCLEIPITVIWRNYIYPKFHISRETLYNIINTDIEGELKKMEALRVEYEEQKKRQLQLF